MKKNIFLLCFLTFSNAWAQKIWLLAPDLFPHSNDQSYSDFLSEKIRNVPIDPQLLRWSQTTLENEKLNNHFFNELEDIENNQVVGAGSRELIEDLLTKLNERASPAQRNSLKKNACKWLSIDRQLRETSLIACNRESLSLRALKEKFPSLDSLMVEDIRISSKDLVSVQVEKGAIYNWKLISNSQKMISFRGTAQELQSQHFAFQSLINGTCESFTHNLDDMELLSRGMIYFSPECQKSLTTPETSSARAWYEKNRPWIIPAAIVALGVMAYQLKDKNIVLDKPSFR